MNINDYNLIIFDLDGTLRRCTVLDRPCPNKPGEWELMPYTKQLLSYLDRRRFMFGIASNQGGVGLGYMTYKVAYQMALDTAKAAFGESLHHNAVQICPHKPDEGCICRKPKPWMLWQIMEWYRIPTEATLYVGDQDSDADTAEAAGCHFMPAKDFFNWS